MGAKSPSFKSLIEKINRDFNPKMFNNEEKRVDPLLALEIEIKGLLNMIENTVP